MVLTAAVLLAAASALLPPPGRNAAERGLLALLEHLPADTRCGASVGRLAALAQGGWLPVDDCLPELAASPLRASLLAELARDPNRPVGARFSALSALLRAHAGPPGLADALIGAPRTSPAMRRAAFSAAVDEVGAPWAERGLAVAVHGLNDRGLAGLFALGEQAQALELAQALGASRWQAVDPAVLADVYEGLGTDRPTLEEAVVRHRRGQAPLGLPSAWWPAFWRHGCEEGCVPLLRALLAIEARAQGEGPDRGEASGEAPPTRPGADVALDVLYAEAGPSGDHVRRELAAVEGWIGQVSESRRTARLVAAVLHAEATPADPVAASVEWGDPHAVLTRGAGSPGATALVAADLALGAGVPLEAWVGDRGVALQVGGRAYAVEPCSAARVLPGWEDDWREVPLGGIDALALVEGAAQALLTGDFGAARSRIDAARASWPDAPGLGAVEAAALAFEGPPPTVPVAPAVIGRRGRRAPAVVAPEPPLVQVDGIVGIQAPESLLVSRPRLPARRGRRGEPAPSPDLRVEARAALRALRDRVLALAPEPADRVRAAWWAAAGGEPELARALWVAAGDPTGLPADLLVLRNAVARALGEPGTVPPEEGGAARSAPARPEPPCPTAFRANPPPWAFSGGTPGDPDADVEPPADPTEPTPGEDVDRAEGAPGEAGVP